MADCFIVRRSNDSETKKNYIQDGLVLYFNNYNNAPYQATYDLLESATVAAFEFCGNYTSIPDSSHKGRWAEIHNTSNNSTTNNIVLGFSQYNQILEIYYGGWIVEGAVGVEIYPNQNTTIGVTCNDSNLLIYKNGVLANTLNISSAPLSLNFKKIITMKSTYMSNRELSGQIKSLRVYNRILTSEEISNNYNVDKLNFNL